jgi:hypothetical protein
MDNLVDLIFMSIGEDSYLLMKTLAPPLSFKEWIRLKLKDPNTMATTLE